MDSSSARNCYSAISLGLAGLSLLILFHFHWFTFHYLAIARRRFYVWCSFDKKCRLEVHRIGLHVSLRCLSFLSVEIILFEEIPSRFLSSLSLKICNFTTPPRPGSYWKVECNLNHINIETFLFSKIFSTAASSSSLLKFINFINF